MGWVSITRHEYKAFFSDGNHHKRKSSAYWLRGSYLTKFSGHEEAGRTVEWSVDMFEATVNAVKPTEIRVHCANGKKFSICSGKEKKIKKWTKALTTSSCAEITDLYDMGDSIGEGSFGTVFVAHDKFSGQRVAVKVINKKLANERDLGRIQKEVKVLCGLKHDKIVRVHDIFDTPSVMYIVMEYMNGGNLDGYIGDLGSISERSAPAIINGLLDAVQYLHERNLVHRDLKPENTLFSMDPLCVKIADFGFVGSLEPEEEGYPNLLKTLLGTWHYVAPEQTRREKYGPAVDIWATGVTMYEILSGTLPFDDENVPDIIRKIQAGEVEFPEAQWGNISDNAKDLIRTMLEVDPAKRPTAREAKQHPWLLDEAVLHHHGSSMDSRKSCEGETLKEEMYNLPNIKQVLDGRNRSRIRGNGYGSEGEEQPMENSALPEWLQDAISEELVASVAIDKPAARIYSSAAAPRTVAASGPDPLRHGSQRSDPEALQRHSTEETSLCSVRSAVTQDLALTDRRMSGRNYTFSSTAHYLMLGEGDQGTVEQDPSLSTNGADVDKYSAQGGSIRIMHKRGSSRRPRFNLFGELR